MSRDKLTSRQEGALRRQEEQFKKAKAEIDDLGFVLQGSIVERWMECGKPACRCHEDPEARHGPYYQWTWKTSGKTRAVYLTKEQAALCKKWSMNNRRLNTIISRLRSISLRAARSYEIRKQ